MTLSLSDFAAGNVALPPLAAIEAALAARTPVWRSQHATGCRWRDKPMPTDEEWRRKPCKCPQSIAFHSKADITGYGGAAGGGKSDLIIGLALTRHRRSIIFRREALEARDLFTRAVEVVDGAGVAYKANHGLTTVTIVDSDRTLEFGGVKNADDWRKYRGRAKDGYFFDEGTEFDELTFRSLIGWNRTTIPSQRCRVVVTFNPPGVKRGQWIKTYFAPWLDPKHPNPAEYGELRWFTTINMRDIEVPSGDALELVDDETGAETIRPACVASSRDGETFCSECGRELIYPLSRTFIKALLDDNEYLKATNYRATLQGLPEPLRSQLLNGDFEAEEADEPWQCIPTKWVQLAQERWIELPRPEAPLSAIGADPARGGKDRTAFCARIGNWYDYPVAYPGVETPTGRDVIRKLHEVALAYKVVRRIAVGMDVVGVGSSPADFAAEMNLQLVALSGGEGAPDGARDRSGMLSFANMRAYWYWSLREALNPETGSNIAIPPDRELLADLCAPKYDTRSGRIVLESKDEIRKRLGRSPDKGDALVYAFAARPQDVGYETIQSRSAVASQLTSPLSSSWKSKKGL